MQKKVTYKEFYEMMQNIEFVDKDIYLDGNVISNQKLEALIDLWEQKGYKRDNDDNFLLTFLTYIDSLAMDMFYSKFQEVQLDIKEMYDSFINGYYR